MKYMFENGEENSEKMTPMLIEKAVGFFLENQMMVDIVLCYFLYKSRIMPTEEPLKCLKAHYMV